MIMENRYEVLADYLRDHLWMRNKLDYDFLASFPEFIYTGLGYRVLFFASEKDATPRSCKNQSFSKTKEGAKEFILNAQTYDKDFVLNLKPYVFESQIEGFDIHLALMYFKSNRGLVDLSAKTIETFINEDEIIAFSHAELMQILL
jgi:hypothetical protein